MAAETGHPMAFCIGNENFVPLVPSEEHLPIEIPKGQELPSRGSEMYLIPRHVCPTVNLAERALLVVNENEVTEIDIDGRAHDGPLLRIH